MSKEKMEHQTPSVRVEDVRPTGIIFSRARGGEFGISIRWKDQAGVEHETALPNYLEKQLAEKIETASSYDEAEPYMRWMVTMGIGHAEFYGRKAVA